ncbi:type II toxin-antitoxin system RelB/DinJ family antitoxin [Propionibacterium australiense]|uniref:RelB antitoxin/Antitoxin DinJ n=1 Tax=Propionibacterium australiense TaxID=119981 RepID=A0A383S9C5_9ACTN|nr:type II toxin-antitoxin system RelB/DinJ family antitoxin [Propionibacterium australiense]RLP06345.1 translation repressor RelB [Propionibacterium australiense]SYZ34517.1 RelB antitoxin/Antitoxin DinJ [Propionibacterium australiense]VEH89818.1 addiction module antitoxin, RelB/DinJ family [Propionibacterium australiense]
MATRQIATRVDAEQAELFKETTRRLGTTPADALRMFVTAFNSHRGFPYDVRLSEDVEPFATEEDATRFATDLSLKAINEAR